MSFIRIVSCLAIVGLQLIFLIVMPSLASENATIVQEEKDGLLYMSDEEKLAGDVYHIFYSRWNLLTFSHIESDERYHEEILRTVLSRYGVDYTNKGFGMFSNSSHQSLYAKLVQKGNSTLKDALETGAMIEELDLSDLDKYMAQTEKSDLIGTYQTLTRGSENHLQIFVSTLKKHGFEHTPVYLNQTRYAEIIQSGAT